MSAPSAWLLAGALWTGCLLPGPWWLLVLAVAAMPIGMARRRDGVRIAAMSMCLLLLGSGLAGGRLALADGAVLAAVAEAGGAVEVLATVVTEPRETAHGTWAVVRVGAVDGAPVRERAGIRLGDAPPSLGARLRLRVTARPLADQGFDAHLRRLHAVALLAPAGRLEVVGEPATLWRLTSGIRERAREIAGARLDADRAAVLTGLLTGDVRGQSPERRAQLAAAGLTHLVVVSGRHVGLLLAGVLGLAALLGAGARGRRWTGLGALIFYVLLVRWQPSVLRAGVMAGLVLTGGLLGRRADARHSLAMAVVVLLLVDPLLAGHLGFGLSVTATAGVLVLAPWLAPRLPGPRTVRVLIAASLGAQLGAAPLLLTLDQGISLATVPANLVSVPLAAVAQVVGLLAVGVGLAWPSAGGLLAGVAGLPVGGILAVAGWAADGARVDVAALARPGTAALVAALGAALALRRRAPRLGVAALTGVIGLAALPSLAPSPSVDHLSVTALDVGQGDAFLVEVPGGAAGTVRILVDGGPDARAVLHRLRERRVRRLDVVVMSHPHHDHTGGLPAVLSALPVGVLLVGPTPLDPFGVALSAAETEQRAVERGVPVQRVAAGHGFALGSARVRVLSPPADGSLAYDLNEDSVVLHIALGSRSILLTGDAEVGAQTRLLTQPGQLRADILKVPHHGGATNTPGFLAAVGASHALIGVGVDNDYGHPHGSVLEELTGTTVHRTDEDGTVSLALTPDGVVRRPRRRRPLHCRPCPGRRCTCSPGRRSCSSGGPPRICSTSCAPMSPTASRSSTSAPWTSRTARSPTCGPAPCSAAPGRWSSGRRRSCRPS